jgi:hypothetical protein
MQQKIRLLTHELNKAPGLASRRSKSNPKQKRKFPQNSPEQVRVPYHQKVGTEGIDQCRARMRPPFPRQPSVVEGAGGGGRRQLPRAQGCPRRPAAWGGEVGGGVGTAELGGWGQKQKRGLWRAWPTGRWRRERVSRGQYCWAGMPFFFFPCSPSSALGRMYKYCIYWISLNEEVIAQLPIRILRIVSV